MKTRTKKPTASKKTPTIETATPTQSLTPAVSNPPQLFVLPSNISPQALIITIANTRYLACPEQGFYQFTRTCSPKTSPRSWLLAPPHSDNDKTKTTHEHAHKPLEAGDVLEEQRQQDEGEDDGESYILSAPTLLVATSIDPLFILLAVPNVLWPLEHAGHYEAVEDKLRTLASASPHLGAMLEGCQDSSKLVIGLERRIRDVCDELSVGGDGEKLFCFSLKKLALVLLGKATRMVETGLPRGWEEKFVTRVLERPVLGLRREEGGGEGRLGSEGETAEDPDAGVERESESASQSTSQETITSNTTATTTPSTAPTSQQSNVSHTTPPGSPPLHPSPPTLQPSLPPPQSPQISHLLRLRTSLTFLLNAYIAPCIHLPLQPLLHAQLPFHLLDAHLATLAQLKKEAYALRSLSDNTSRTNNKRSVQDDADDDEQAKKRRKKKADEEREALRKKGASLGVKRLGKVNTSGMMKMEGFFKKKGS